MLVGGDAERDADALRQEVEQLKGLVGHLKKYAKDSAINTARAVLKNDDHPAGIVGRDMKLLYVNQSFCHLLDYAPEDILGQRYTMLLEGNSTDIYDFFRAEAEVVRQRVDVRRKNGGIKVYDLTKTVVRLPIAHYFFTVFHMHPPGFQDSLSAPAARLELERYLAQRERERAERELAALQLEEDVARLRRRDDLAEKVRRAHELADALLGR
jgi:PAS domain-containing protein